MRKFIRRTIQNLLRRGYEAAGGSGRWPVAAMMASQPAASLASRAVLAQRASYLVANAPIAESISNTLCTNLIGDGPSIRPGHPNAAIRDALEDAWDRFYSRACIEGGDLVSMLNRIVRGFVTHGESFVRFVTTQRGELRLQLLSPEQVDASLNRDNGDGSRIIAGIELGPNGERWAYHILPESPTAIRSLYAPPVRVDASDICHVYEPRFPGQIRGVSWLHSVLTSIVEYDALEDAALAKAKVSALFCAFLRDLDGTAMGDATKFNPAELSMEPGTVRMMPAGADISFAPTSDMSGLGEFLKHVGRSIASGAGVPYTLVCDDLEGVNYSSARVGLQNFWRRCTAIRSSVLVSRLLQPTWERFVTLEILSGRLYAPDFERNPEPYFSVVFLWPQPASLDPAKETSADVEALRNGLRSRSEIISARGRDIADVDAEIEADTFTPIAAPTPQPTVGIAA